MPSTTSGTTNFYLDVDDIIEDALEPLGNEYTSGTDQSKFRRSLNLLLIELQNKRIPLHKIEDTTVAIVPAQSQYTLNASISDVLECTLKNTNTNTEYPLNRLGIREYHNLTTKTTTGQPVSFTLDRKSQAPILTVWPVPDTSSTWELNLLVAKRIEDITASYQRVDLPYRYYPLIVSWLSYKIAKSIPNFPLDRLQLMKMDLQEIGLDTVEEDQERVDIIIRPGGVSGR